MGCCLAGQWSILDTGDIYVFLTIEKIFNSLQYHVNKNVDETLYKNKVFLSSKWNLFEYNILRWSQRHNYYILLTSIFSILLVTNLILWKEFTTPFAIKYLPRWDKLTEWQDGFLAGQLTIVGVVYPLVIGLIGVLFQNKSAKKALFPIYQMYSGFMFAGLSGLFLSMFIIVGYFLRAGIDDSTYLAICITTALWLMFNLLLTSWFFTATFLMLDEVKRDWLIIRFTIHELCQTDIRHRIGNLLLLNSIKNNMLNNPDENVLKISTDELFYEKASEIKIHLKNNANVTNIYYSVINLVIFSQIKKLKFLLWLNRHDFGKRLVSKKYFHRLFVDSRIKPKLSITPILTQENKTVLIVARYTDFNLDWLSKELIKFSIKTHINKEGYNKSLTSMLLGLFGTVNDSLREKNVIDFKYALDNIVKWHVEISSSLQFSNNDKEDNWLLLQPTNAFGRNYLDEILSEYYNLTKSAVELIPENIQFFDEIIYLHRRLFARKEELVEREGLSLIYGSYLTWSLLMEWRSYSSSSPDIRVANKYEDVLFDFVGAWESWLFIIEQKSRKLDNPTKSIPLFISHLEYTAHTVISALRYNNLEAASWGVDMLNNWYKKLPIKYHSNISEEYRWLSERVTHDLLLKDLDDKSWATILNGYEYNTQSAFNLSFKNSAFDIRVITACYILLKPNLNDNPDIKRYIKALLFGTALHPTGTIGNKEKCISNASDILGAYIRHRDYNNYGDDSYGSWLSKVTESFGRVSEQRRVSGRIYSGWGRNDPHSMGGAYVEIAISFSKNKWNLARKWFDIIFSSAFSYQSQKSLILDLQGWIRLSEEIKDPFLISKEELDSNLNNFKDSIRMIIDKIEKQRNDIVAKAEIDANILIRFGYICTEVLMNEDQNLEFPMSLFKSIGFNGTSIENNLVRLDINGFLKEDIAKGIDINRADNEDDWLKELTEENTRTIILRKILQYEFSDSKVYTDAYSNFLDISEYGKNIINPILLSGNFELNNFLFDTRYNQELAAKFDISFVDGNGRYYICHIGNIIVYDIYFSDVNCSILTTRDLFKNIEFRKYEDGLLVNLNYESSDNNNIGTLSINYSMCVTLTDKLPFIRTEITPL